MGQTVEEVLISFLPPDTDLASLFGQMALETGDPPDAIGLLDEWYDAASDSVKTLLEGEPEATILANNVRRPSHTLTVRAPKRVLEALSVLRGVKIERRAAFV